MPVRTEPGIGLRYSSIAGPCLGLCDVPQRLLKYRLIQWFGWSCFTAGGSVDLDFIAVLASKLRHRLPDGIASMHLPCHRQGELGPESQSPGAVSDGAQLR